MLRKTSNFLHASLLVLRKPPREKSLRDNSCSAAEFHHYSAGTGPLPVPPASHRKTVTTTRSSPARLSHWHPSAPTVPAHRKVPKCKHSHRSQTSQRASVRAVAHGHVFDLSVSDHATREAMRNKQSVSITAGSLSLIVCHANSPTGGSFPSEQIQSQHDSTGRAGIGCPTEDRIRDQKVAGSNPVTSTRF